MAQDNPLPKLRGLGQFGVISDLDPIDLPPSAFTFASNVRFRNGRVTAAPVFKTVLSPLGTTNPRYCAGITPNASTDWLFLGYENGTTSLWSNGSETAYSPDFTFTGSISGTTMVVTGTPSGQLAPGQTITGTGVTANSEINAFGTASLTGCTISGTTLTVGSVASGTIYVGMTLTDADELVPVGTTIVSGASLTWTISNSVTVSVGENMTCTSSGGAGSYVLSASSSVGSETLTAAYTPNSSNATWTSCFLEGVFYLNRSDRVPWSLNTSNTCFQYLANMDSQWQAQILRAAGGTLVALNVLENGTQYPNKVKTAEFPTYGAVPVSWDFDLASTDATENELAQMQGPITDACNLGLNLIIYGEYEAWLMFLSGDIEVFNYQKLPFSKGSINANCSVEINSQNYVFGVDDIWVHDGVSEKSICDQRTRDFIFGAIDMSQTQWCHVVHNRQLHEIHFNFVSGDGYLKFANNGQNGCNRSAVYDYIGDKWTYGDLPLVYSGTTANVDQEEEYATATQTYASITASYSAFDDTAKRVLVYIGDDSTPFGLTRTLYAYDPLASSLPGVPNSVVAYSVNTAATGYPYLYRLDMDLDSLPDSDLQGYKTLSYIIPIGRIDPASSAEIQFNIGISDYPDQQVQWSGYMGFDAETNYKLDYNAAGRYLSYEVLFQDYNQFSWSGFDFDIIVTAER